MRPPRQIPAMRHRPGSARTDRCAPPCWRCPAPAAGPPCHRPWQGVQTDLDLPAPAIAVAGPAGHQLWFSFAEPLPAAQARAFVERLRQRYLGEVPAHRVTVWPAPDATRSPPWRPAEPVPALLAGGERWSAFVASDLAPMFSDDPWLDLPPSPEGQAELLSRLQCITAVELQRALQRLQGPAPAPAAAASSPASAAPPATVNSPPAGLSTAGPWTEPARFLLDVMNDSSVTLALRIEAAKALLPHADAVRPPGATMPPLPE